MDKKRDFCGWAMLAAALLLVLMCACGGAAQKINGKADLVTQCNLELDALRELGLFTAEFEVTMADEVPDFEYDGYGSRPELAEDKYEGVITLRGYGRAEQLYSYNMDVDTDTGKISGLMINAKPRKDWVPYHIGFWSGACDGGNSAMGFYDNCEALFDPEMTLGQMCAAWAQYQGYERWELPEGAAEDMSFIDARELEAWDSGYNSPSGITFAFYRGGKRDAEYYAFNYTPAAAGPYFTICPAEGPYVPGEHTYSSPQVDSFDENDERSVVRLINDQLDELRALGLLRSGLEVSWQDGHSNITAGRISEEFTGQVYFIGHEHDNCNYCLCYNAGTDKIDWLSICPKPGDGSASVADVYDAGYGAVIDEALTIGEYCELWAEYQGYERWELPEGADEGTRYLDAHTLSAWEDGIAGIEGEYYIDGLEISFFRSGSDEPECAYVKYGPSDIGPCVTIGSEYLFEHGFYD